MAHVKWFSDYDWSTLPRTLEEVTTRTFWELLVLSVVTLIAFVLIDAWVERLPPARRASAWLEQRAHAGLLVIRVAAFATLIVAWQQGTLMTPDLPITSAWVSWGQLCVILLLLFPASTTLAGLGIFVLWGYGAKVHGLFHMLDYVNVLGVAYFLAVRPLRRPLLAATALRALHATVGFSLVWLGCEKLVYPAWGLALLEQHPALALGLGNEYFLTAAAFVEMTLGYLLIICLLSRTLSVTITIVFFLTTCVFGKVEVIGHTLIHASLIVFLLEGKGHAFRPPGLFHRQLPLRAAFAAVNFVVLVLGLLWVYSAASLRIQAGAGEAKAHVHAPLEVADPTAVPTLSLEISEEAAGSTLHLVTARFRFAPEHADGAHVEGEGHAHLYVDGRKVGRIYAPWHFLPALPPGQHVVRVTLNTNDHREYAAMGQVVAAEVVLKQ